MKEMNYITKASGSQHPAAHGEKMEPGAVHSRAKKKTLLKKKAYINGKSAGAVGKRQESISYMADYIADDEGRILAVHYDPVPFFPDKPGRSQ